MVLLVLKNTKVITIKCCKKVWKRMGMMEGWVMIK